eukprot:1191583-Prorocentrum_minimum.AAC.2
MECGWAGIGLACAAVVQNRLKSWLESAAFAVSSSVTPATGPLLICRARVLLVNGSGVVRTRDRFWAKSALPTPGTEGQNRLTPFERVECKMARGEAPRFVTIGLRADPTYQAREQLTGVTICGNSPAHPPALTSLAD